MDETAFKSVVYVLNQSIVAIRDGKVSYDEIESLGKKIYRLSKILDIYLGKKKNQRLTKDEFIDALAGVLTEMKREVNLR